MAKPRFGCAQSHHMMVPGRYELRVQPQPSSVRVGRVRHATSPMAEAPSAWCFNEGLLFIWACISEIVAAADHRPGPGDPGRQEGGNRGGHRKRWQIKANVSYCRCARAVLQRIDVCNMRSSMSICCAWQYCKSLSKPRLREKPPRPKFKISGSETD